MSCIIYIAQSLDGYIAGPGNDLSWLDALADPDGSDFGFSDFIETVDALVMGRITYETVCAFNAWPYTKPVYVASRSHATVLPEHQGKVQRIDTSPRETVQTLYTQGKKRLYIDGGALIQSYLKEDLIDEMIITSVPVLLGAGTSLFGSLNAPLNWALCQSKTLGPDLVQSHYRRIR